MFLAIFFVMACLYSFKKGSKESEVGDFFCFWNAGKNFYSGQSLYNPGPRHRPFIYPSFAAMIFGLSSFVPMKVAAGLFTLFNVFQWIFTFFLLSRLIDFFYPKSKYRPWILFFSFIGSFKFFLNNLNMVQVNQLILLLCLLGFYYFIKKKETYALIYFSLATFIKITPVFFLVWIIIRGPRKLWNQFLVLSLAFFLLPWTIRGSRFLTDFIEYYDLFLAKFAKGGATVYYSNQNLAATLHRLFLPLKEIDTSGFHMNPLLVLPESVVKWIYLSLVIILLVSFLWILMRLRKLKVGILFWEPSLVFLLSYLISGVTWKAHLVGMSLVYASFFGYVFSRLNSIKYKFSYQIFFFYILFCSFAGKSLIGHKWQRLLGGYGIYTFLMLILYLWCLYRIFFESGKRKANITS